MKPSQNDIEGKKSPLGILLVIAINAVAMWMLTWPLIAAHRGC